MDLVEANLRGEDLRQASLQEAGLHSANLCGVNLSATDLEGAKLTGASFDYATIVTDGTQWTPDTDMARFTDSDHPDFWRSDNPYSPAYKPKEQE